MPPARKSRATKTGGVAKSTRAKQAPRRNAEADKTDNVQESSTRSKGTKRPASDDGHDTEGRDAEEKPKAGRGRPKANKTQKVAEANDEDELTQVDIQTTVSGPAIKKRKTRRNVEAEIPETQQREMEIPETQQVDALDIVTEEDERMEEPPVYLPKVASVQRHQSQLLFNTSRRPVSASDSEMGDATLRRRLGELTRKYEALEARYRDLRDISVQEAERNFDRLKKHGEERANTDKQLIATLKAELAAETEIANDCEQARKEVEVSRRKVEEVQGTIDRLQASLAEAKAEVKTLSTKLAAARSVEPANVKVPGSAMKSNHATNRLAASAMEAANQVAQKKENLYGDLTGLLVCGVKRENDEEVFDCVQTGRNGTLHFKLSIASDGPSDKFDDAEFMYMPQLDAARDEELIDTLPDYLVEEITFPRLQAAKFYSRVVKALNGNAE